MAVINWVILLSFFLHFIDRLIIFNVTNNKMLLFIMFFYDWTIKYFRYWYS